MPDPASPQPPVIVKVGGSLFDWPDLRLRLREFLATLAGQNLLLIPGGGLTADAVRAYDRAHGLGEESAHWLALRALSLNAHLLAALLEPAGQVVEGLSAAHAVWRRNRVPVLDMYRFARGDEHRPGRLHHSWVVTSDSLAARVAAVADAERLILLKSAPMPATDWVEAVRLEYVDPMFDTVARGAGFAVEAVDLRSGQSVTVAPAHSDDSDDDDE
jgi:5-(aminomethyl)-3-furanmethanol phosphate kinase